MSPYEYITSNLPNLSYIRILGSLAYILVKEPKPKDLSNKAEKGILVGFESSNNYLVYIPRINKVVNTRDIKIIEDLYYKDEYILNEDLFNLLDEESLDYNDFISLKDNLSIRPEVITLEDNIENISTNINPNINTNNNNKDNNEELDELDPNYIIKDTSGTRPKETSTKSTKSTKSTNIRKNIKENIKDNTNTSKSITTRSSTKNLQVPNIRGRLRSTSPDELAQYASIINTTNNNTSNTTSLFALASLAYLDLINKGERDYINTNYTYDFDFDSEPLLNIDLNNYNKDYNIEQAFISTKINNSKVEEYNKESNKYNSSSINISSNLLEPKSYTEAINSINKEEWHESMLEELRTLEYNNTWEVVPCPKGVKPIKTRWVYKIKDLESSPRFKSRFVAKGFEQIYGLDYLESFASVIKQMAWKLLFAIAILNNLIIFKIDMISAFTQGFIDLDIYIEQPIGFPYPISKKYPNIEFVLKLNKALYGLKQSARIWYNTLKPRLIELGFIVLKSDSCIYINYETRVIISIYVDDLAILAPSIEEFNLLTSKLSKFFKFKNLGIIKDYLGIDIDYNQELGYIKLSQSTYINKLLKKFDMFNSTPKYTPLDPKIKLEPNKEQATKEEIKYFQRLIGSLLYITLGTRIDILYAVIKLSRYASNPSEQHFTSIKRVFRYLKATINYGITYYRDSNKYISGYCDADYAGDLVSGKSTSRYIFLLANGPISWKSKLQTIIAQSTTEAEYVAINAATKEAIFIISLLKELGYYKQSKFPLYTDNNGALLLAKNPVFHERTKHIAVKYHYIRELINKGIIDLIYISTQEQKADGLTKALERTKFNRFLS